MNIIIGFGGNLADVGSAFGRAVRALDRHDGLTVLGRSSLYRTVPVGPEQRPYLNAAVMVAADTGPRDLLQLCQTIETDAGRNRSNEERWGPRILDLDLLIGDSLICRGSILELPHPRLAERAFALVPAAEIAPDWAHPIEGKTLADLAEKALLKDSGAVELVGEWKPRGPVAFVGC